jgi:hypothetical protein
MPTDTEIPDGHLQALQSRNDEIERLRRIIHLPLSKAELKLVDKNCDWIAFKHAWNAIMKSRGAVQWAADQ